MKNIFALVALISCGICSSQESAVEVQQGNINIQKKKSYLQGQIENPNSKLYNAENPNDISTSNRKYGSVDHKNWSGWGQDSQNIYENNLKELTEKADEAIYQVSQNKTLKEILAQEKNDELLLHNISKEKESEIKQIISQRVKINKLKIEELENKIFRDKILNNAFVMLIILMVLYVAIRIIKQVKLKDIKVTFTSLFSRISINKIPKLSRNEILLLSFSIGLIFSIILGNLIPENDYYRLSRKQGQAIKVSEGLSTYSIESFNYSIAIVIFILVSLSIYFVLTRINNEK